MKKAIRICSGSDCRKRKKGNAEIAKLLSKDCRVGKMKCQDFCKGPVVEVQLGKKRILFRKLRGKKLRTDLRDYLIHGTLSSALEKCRIG